MKSRSFIAVLATLVIVASCAAGLTLAARRGTGARALSGARGLGRAVHLVGRLARDTDLQARLGLSADQVARLQGIRDHARETLPALRTAARDSGQRLREVREDATSSRAEIEKQSDQLASARQAAGRAARDIVLDARDVLTVEQRGRLRAEIKQWIVERRGRPGPHGSWGGRGDAPEKEDLLPEGDD